MKDWLRKLTGSHTAQDRKDLLRRYVEGETSAEEQSLILSRLQESKEWQRELEREKHYIALLRSLPQRAPADHLWNAILNDVQGMPVKKSRIASLSFYPQWQKYAFACAAMLILIFCGAYFFPLEPNYQVVTVQDSDRYRAEAEAFVAHHDLAGESLFTRDSLIAYYTYDQSSD